MDIIKASNRLSQLDLKLNMDNLMVNILWFRVMANSGQWCIGRHTHSSYEFHFVSSGGCIVTTDEGHFEAHAGEFYLTAPGVYHEQKSVGSGEYTEYSLNCDIMELEEKASEAQVILKVFKNAKCRTVKDSLNILGYFNEALGEAYSQKIGYYNNIQNIARIILTMSARALNEETSFSYDVPLKPKKDDFRFLQIEKFIEDNITSTISTVDIANYMYLSDKQVCRIIKERKGCSTKELINSIKLNKAKALLKNTEFRIKEISNMLGFTSEYYFNQFFKREEGYPPGRYRNNALRD